MRTPSEWADHFMGSVPIDPPRATLVEFIAMIQEDARKRKPRQKRQLSPFEYPQWVHDVIIDWAGIHKLPSRVNYGECLRTVYELCNIDNYTPIEVLITCAWIVRSAVPQFIASPMKLRKPTATGDCTTFERHKQMLDGRESGNKNWGYDPAWSKYERRKREIMAKWAPPASEAPAPNAPSTSAEYLPNAPKPTPIVEPAPVYSAEEIQKAKATVGQFLRTFGGRGTPNRERQVAARNRMLAAHGVDMSDVPGWDDSLEGNPDAG